MITVIIPTKGITEILEKILYLLNFQTIDGFHVIVVNTSDSSHKNFKINSKYILKVVEIKSGGTKSIARNLGLYLSQTDYVLFIDADMIPHPGLIEQHLKFLKFGYFVVGLELRTKKEEEYLKTLKNIEKIKNPKELMELFSYKFSNRSRRNLKLRELEWYKFLTGNLSGKRECFIKAGMFNTSFISYGFEDIELGYRVNKMGGKILFNPHAVTIHLHPLSTERRIQNKKESVTNLMKFYQTYGNKKILEKLGINMFSRLIYDFIPKSVRMFLEKTNEDYKTNYYFWKEWNIKN
ncbi:MAG: glycosyltransferase [Candidatus Calescibacterium sp.]|nr:glycosyltransferase [Candidatus Calescibacterium sp.]MCX7758408.1 glycosyltransferase [bacterium]MDW8195902.1 glycosyltransferase [Candidatus Calescibacterium sp.]